MENKKIIGNTVGVPNPKSDWEQNDKSKADYVKNRTHYTEAIALWDYTVQRDSDYAFETPNGVNYYDGFKLYINGVETDMVFLDSEDYSIVNLPLENMAFVYAGQVINGEYEFWLGHVEAGAFSLWQINEMFPEGTHIKLCAEKTIKLGEKYIPDSIARTQYVDKRIGDVDVALDAIIAIQNELIGGA